MNLFRESQEDSKQGNKKGDMGKINSMLLFLNVL
jgi:hypothetical protein